MLTVLSTRVPCGGPCGLLLHVDAVALTVAVHRPSRITQPIRRSCGLLLWTCPRCEHAGGLHETGYVHPDGIVRPLPAGALA